MINSDLVSDKVNLVTGTGMQWLDTLEKEFDKAFVDLDVIISNFDEDRNEAHFFDARQKMGDMASIILQLAHKASVVFENNTKIERDYYKLRDRLIEAESEKKILEKQLEAKVAQLNLIADTYHSKRKPDPRIMPLSVPTKSTNGIQDDPDYSKVYAQQEIKCLRRENITLRKHLVNLESELLGARLKARYLDKELSGRIQQIQLLSERIFHTHLLYINTFFMTGKPDLKSQDQDRVWNQLEAEIHLHRHKTVVRAYRDRLSSCPSSTKDLPPGHGYELLKKRQGVGDLREVIIDRKADEGLGISITGGKDHSIPVLISQIHPNTPASRFVLILVNASRQ